MRIKCALCVFATSLFCLAFCATAQAQQRTFVSIGGKDTNSCLDASAPCRTFQRGHNAVAAGGEVVALTSGGYGKLTLTKSVTISGDGVNASVTAPSGTAVTISAAGVIVNLRSLSIDGLGTADNGINLTNAAALHVENCVIDGFVHFGIKFFPTSAAHLFVKDTVVRGTGATGATGDSGISVDGGNGAGGGAQGSIDHADVTRHRNGILANNSGQVTVRNSTASGNTTTAFNGANSGELTVERCVATNNVGGVSSSMSAVVHVSNSTIAYNGFGFFNFDTVGSVLLSRVTGTSSNIKTNTVEGNGSDTSGTIGTYTAK